MAHEYSIGHVMHLHELIDWDPSMNDENETRIISTLTFNPRWNVAMESKARSCCSSA